MASRPIRALLLYDGACGSCAAFARVVRALDFEGKVDLVPLQDQAARDRFEAQLGDAYWSSFHLVVGGDETIRSGAEALEPLAKLLPAVRPFAPVLFQTPGIRLLPRVAYRAASFARTCQVAAGRA
jgi:predicted DCC family thiol-disulfide oxidoreductase YuxK